MTSCFSAAATGDAPGTAVAASTAATDDNRRTRAELTATLTPSVEQLEVDALRVRAGLGRGQLSACAEVFPGAAGDDHLEPGLLEVDRPGGGQRAAAQLVVAPAERAPRVVEVARVGRRARAPLERLARVEVEAENGDVARERPVAPLLHLRHEPV